MDRRSRVFILTAAIALSATTTLAVRADEFEQHGAHEHGKITINAALDRQELSIELDAPADNVIGFEHTPHTDAEKAAVRDADVLLRNGQGLFGFPPAAQCRFTGSQVTAPHWEVERSETRGESGHEHHADYEARLTYQCKVPQELAWFEPWLLGKLHEVREARVNLITASGQRSQVVTHPRDRVALR